MSRILPGDVAASTVDAKIKQLTEQVIARRFVQVLPKKGTRNARKAAKKRNIKEMGAERYRDLKRELKLQQETLREEKVLEKAKVEESVSSELGSLDEVEELEELEDLEASVKSDEWETSVDSEGWEVLVKSVPIEIATLTGPAFAEKGKPKAGSWAGKRKMEWDYARYIK
ncbi:hypothetical protein BT96DRAFT_414067 [Gymnopus androsaceus JB14]|uniref:Uncharacterized protein n=1 Tax=Gymnopus androsaceus JB14 TaxID=1447944 RepID=A0A6A4GVA9_9AGAR|nr:hypothetical protein BT96DRAFT_414067 [Gymnopus androsaceus JB14]